MTLKQLFDKLTDNSLFETYDGDGNVLYELEGHFNDEVYEIEPHFDVRTRNAYLIIFLK